MNTDDVQKYLHDLQQESVILFGIGSMAYRVLDILVKAGIQPVMACDNNETLWGKHMNGDMLICSYEEAKKQWPKHTVLLTVSVNNAIDIRKTTDFGKNRVLHMQCPFKIDNVLLNQDDYSSYEDFFADDLSKDIFRDFLFYKMTGNMTEMMKYTDGDTYFDKDIIHKRDQHRFVDVGCYTGDTIADFLVFSDGYESIVGMEVDPGIAKVANMFLKYGRIKNARILNRGGWSETKEIEVNTLEQNEECLFDSANLFNKAKEILPNRFRNDGKKYISVKVQCDTLDNLFCDYHPTLIKINALAADLPILEGTRRIIKNDRPSILMDYGARPEYISGILDCLKENGSDYKLFLREKEYCGDYKTILYAVPI